MGKSLGIRRLKMFLRYNKNGVASSVKLADISNSSISIRTLFNNAFEICQLH